MFKGILYDQGPESTYISGGESSSSIQHQQQHQLNLITAGVGTAAVDGGGGGVVGSGSFMDPNCLYPAPAPLNTYFAGTQFFPSSRS